MAIAGAAFFPIQKQFRIDIWQASVEWKIVSNLFKSHAFYFYNSTIHYACAISRASRKAKVAA